MRSGKRTACMFMYMYVRGQSCRWINVSDNCMRKQALPEFDPHGRKRIDSSC